MAIYQWERNVEDKKKHIAFLVTHGFSARSVLRSGIAKSLVSRGLKVSIISPNADELYFQQECHEEGVVPELAPSITGIEGRFADWCRAYRPYFLDDVVNNTALITKANLRFQTRPISGFFLKTLNRKFAKWLTVRRTYRFIEYKFNRSKQVEILLSKIKPDLLVIANPFGRHEAIYLIHAKELGVPVACEMLSWDNITSKGTPLLMPDYFISWGPIMTEEMVNLYNFPRDKIFEDGVPHFDVYFRYARFTPRSSLVRKLKLPIADPYIFYGMVAPYSCPNEMEILHWLVARLNECAFVKPCSLIIRPHPQTIRGEYARDKGELKRLEGLIGPRVALDIPPVLSDRLAWDLPKTDSYRLASLLAGSAMCLNAGSTLCLEACILDRPVINIGFDGWDELPYDQSARRGLDYQHIAKLLAMGGVRVARSFHDLTQHINAYLENPCLDRAGRKASAMQECGSQDGAATERVVRTLRSLVPSHNTTNRHSRLSDAQESYTTLDRVRDDAHL